MFINILLLKGIRFYWSITQKKQRPICKSPGTHQCYCTVTVHVHLTGRVTRGAKFVMQSHNFWYLFCTFIILEQKARKQNNWTNHNLPILFLFFYAIKLGWGMVCRTSIMLLSIQLFGITDLSWVFVMSIFIIVILYYEFLVADCKGGSFYETFLSFFSFFILT